MRSYLIVVAVTALVTYFLTPLVRKFAIKIRAITPIRKRDVHTEPIPRLGGLAMLFGISFGLAVAWFIPLFRSTFEQPFAPYLLLAMCIIAGVGAIDDVIDLDAVTKLAGQVLASAILIIGGIQLLYLPIAGTSVLGPSIGIPLTILVVVAAMNAINFVDGLDGLAAGITLFAALGLSGYSYLIAVGEGTTRAQLPALLGSLVIGAVIGFLPHNFHPAKIFMGDSGALLLGMMLASTAISLTGQVDFSAVQNLGLGPTLLPVILPLLVMTIPLIDMLLAVIRRTRAGRSPFDADKMHLHHRLLEIGHSHLGAVLIMYLWSLIIVAGTLAMSLLPSTQTTIIVISVFLIALVFTIRRSRNQKKPITKIGSAE